jgi:CDGSH-type Zn-finger protein
LESNSGGEGNQLNEKPKILPLPNGPYYLINNMEPKIVENLQNSEGEPLSTIRGVALCRCGASKNKPFCDGTHGTIGFLVKIKLILPTIAVIT